MRTSTDTLILTDATLDLDDTTGFVAFLGLVAAAAVGGTLGAAVGGAYALGVYHGMQAADAPKCDAPKEK
jgi:hypothetical protein